MAQTASNFGMNVVMPVIDTFLTYVGIIVTISLVYPILNAELLGTLDTL